jgi:HK97 family phage major capsid protein
MSNAIDRNDVASLIAEEYSGQVIKTASQGSTAAAAIPVVNMGTKVTNMSVLAATPTAKWSGNVTNPADYISKARWKNKTLVAESIKVDVPIHEDTLKDVTEDILNQIAELGGQAIGKALDEAVFFGINKPASWTSLDLLAASTASGNVKTVVDGAANKADVYGAGLQVAGQIADKGFDPTAAIAKRSLMYQFANLRDANGNLVLDGDSIRGFDTFWSRNGAWDPAEAVQFIIDPSTARIGIRQDIEVKLLDQAVLGTGDNAINLADEDMIAFRFKARLAYVLADPATAETGESGYGVGAVLPAVTPAVVEP